ncbi:MAG: SIS domain-containing protein [Candidatus Magasanikbacteria bacterium]|nr:SIS domain-containing protein [Candidatus Magasanikbacteria bacterium]
MNLDNLSEIKAKDKGKMLSSIDALVDQCREARRDLQGISFPRTYAQVKNIVVAGMGGSALGAHIIDSLFAGELPIPLEIVNDYRLPRYINKDSLVVLSSYSGSTEEIVSCAKGAKSAGAKIIVIASGKDLAEFKKKEKAPAYLFAPHFNPCGSPRMGLGYSLFGLLLIFGKLGLIVFRETEAAQAIKAIEKYARKFCAEVSLANNKAKQLAERLFQKIPCFLSAAPLAGSIHTLANQINENAKTFAGWFLLPEANHHLMEGLAFPQSNKENLSFVFFESNGDSPKLIRRFALTQEVVKKAGVAAMSYKLEEKTALGQVFELLVLGSYASFYLAMLYDLNPTPIPMVDWFKKQMG